jgi:hypothetical protein
MVEMKRLDRKGVDWIKKNWSLLEILIRMELIGKG